MPHIRSCRDHGVTELIRDMLTSQTPRRNAIAPEIDVITTLTYLATGEMQLYSSDDLGLLQHLCRHLFPIKYIKYDSMVNKIYTYIVCVCARVSERESTVKTGKITPVISKRRLIINPNLKCSFISFLDNQPITAFKRLCHS